MNDTSSNNMFPATASSSNGTQAVSNLLQQMKSGEISKLQLFQQLARLQTTPSAADVAMTANSSQPPPPPSFVSFTLSHSPPSSTTRSSPPRAKPPSTGATIVGTDAEFLATGVSHDQAPQFSVQEWMANKLRAMAPPPSSTPPIDAPNDGESIASSSEQSYLQDQDQPAYVYTPQRHTLDTPQHQSAFFGNAHAHAQSQPPSQPQAPQEYLDFASSFHDDTNDNGPSGRRASLSNAPNSSDDAKFHARVTRWKSQKDAIREQMKQQLLQAELNECTFTPKVNPKSTKVVQRLRGRQSSSSDDTTPIAVSERLYQEADNYKAREELAAKLKAEEEAELQRECTFRPKINKNNSLTDKVKPKYMESTSVPSTMAPAVIEAKNKELAECTFHPKVNPIGPEMVSAQLYLQQDIYERLSRPCCLDVNNNADDQQPTDADQATCPKPTQTRSQDDCYVASRRRSLTSMKSPRGRSNEPASRAFSGTRPRSAGGAMTEEDKEERSKKFQSFLERQQFHEQARKKRIETTKQQLQPEHRPSINKKSLLMMENGRRGDFLERITKYALRKEHDSVKMKTVRVADPNCTFKPQINQHSAKRKPRSVTELSRGDLLRRETTQRLMKLKIEQEEMAALTFRPQLNRVSERYEGKLKILTSPDTYLQRIQQQTQAHMMKQRRAVQEKEMEEFAECTFKPRTIEAPSYVQRIARSVALTKAAKQATPSKAGGDKPEWR